MSGIFGFTYHKPNTEPQLLADTLGALEYWNRNYGREAKASACFSDSGIGCHVEHFSDAFPYGCPILDNGGRNAVVDALLYNRDELTAALGLSGDCAISDEELLLRWIDEKGFEALAEVNGDFAGAILDEAAGEWILFRDHLGVRPLYYYLDDNCFAFSTDLRGLAAMPGADTGVNEMMLYICISGTNSLTLQETDFQRIRCILPASVTRVKKSADGFTLTEQTYWSACRRKIRLPSDEAYRKELRRLITDAVNRRCDAIPGLLGGELSGGLDSTVIDILVARHGRRATFFSWSPDLESLPITHPSDERRTILDICQRENFTCHFMSKNDVFTYDDIGETVVPPYADTYTLGVGSAWLRSQGARVVFTGHGGDEGVSHRGRRYELFRCGEYRTYFRYFRQDLAGKPFAMLRSIRAGWKEAKSYKRIVTANSSCVPANTGVFTGDFARRMGERFVPREMTFNYMPFDYVMQGGTRPRLDNTAYQGALQGVRYLFPYVDHRVMDYALSIPRSQFVGRENTRVVFREAFRDLLPEVLYNRNFKYQASTHERDSKPVDLTKYCVYTEKLLSDMDQDYWSRYFDFNRLRETLLNTDDPNFDINSMCDLTEQLIRCNQIRNVQKNAKRWREFDEQHKTV